MLLELIFTIALSYGLEPKFVQAIALIENPTLNPYAINRNNADGSVDRGLMQLNDSWFNDDNWMDPEVNIHAACKLIKWLRSEGLNWWQVAVAYNCGYYRMMSARGPPNMSLDYAARVMLKWQEIDPWNHRARGGH